MDKHDSTIYSKFNPYENLQQGLTSEKLDVYRKSVLDTLKSPGMILRQKRDTLALGAMCTLPYPQVSDRARRLIEDEVICLISEGAAPYHPRYVAPDYQKLLSLGSEFLELAPAIDLYEATAHLLTAYYYLPSEPVFLGRIDQLLEPFIDTLDEDTAAHVLRSFWLMADRLNPNAFSHANIGPQETKVGRLLLTIDRELKTLTNLTLRYHPDITSDSFALQAVANTLEVTKPYFLNHQAMTEAWGDNYVTASCYNIMRLGGGIYTLVRYNFKEALAQSDGTISDYVDRVIPETVERLVEVVNSRIRYLVEETSWFETNFWVQEGFLVRDRFTAYAGVYGLAEAVNGLMANAGRPDARYGSDPVANELAERIVVRFGEELAKHPGAYCEGKNGQITYHAQVGISSDIDVTPGTRIPTGEEPDLYAHLATEALLHRAIDGGISTILEFDQTAKENPEAVLDIIRAAHEMGIRTLSIGSANSEFIRVSGWLIRRSDLDRAKDEKALRHSSSYLAVGFFDTKPIHLHRIERKV
ncbi:YjjI family glycine radical enzyme [Candidatus Bipolaricaulota bacterium]|nr:YjjI family glycine radical enzyme [Candidatus Bipolaricaulota bacterium]